MIYLVRHGETVWNRRQRLQGRGDSPLSLWGVRLAIAYGEHLKRRLEHHTGSVAIHSSPLGRARQTAAVIADVVGLDADEIVTDDRLAEHDVGDWMGHDWSQIAAEFGVSQRDFRGWDVRPPNGETRREMVERVTAWMHRDRPEDVSIVVSHGGVSRVLRGAYLALEPDAVMDLDVHTHGRFYCLRDGEIVELVADETPPPPEALLG